MIGRRVIAEGDATSRYIPYYRRQHPILVSSTSSIVFGDAPKEHHQNQDACAKSHPTIAAPAYVPFPPSAVAVGKHPRPLRLRQRL